MTQAEGSFGGGEAEEILTNKPCACYRSVTPGTSSILIEALGVSLELEKTLYVHLLSDGK